jgi:Ca2+-transporting ATPase
LPSQEGFSALRTAIRQLLDPLILVLLAAATLAGALGERLDAVMILVIVALNAALSFFQEWRAERALASLSQMLTANATVVRSGRVMKIDARDIVPGDLVRLERGESIPADVKLIDATALIVDESALTGEAHGVTKAPGADPADAALHERQSIAYAGSVVLDGHGAGLVIATGTRSEFGNVAALAASVQRQATPLQKRLSRLARRLGALALLAAVAVALIGLFRRAGSAGCGVHQRVARSGGRARGLAGAGGAQPGAGRAHDGPAQRAGASPARRRIAGVGHGDLHGQDGNA